MLPNLHIQGIFRVFKVFRAFSNSVWLIFSERARRRRLAWVSGARPATGGEASRFVGNEYPAAHAVTAASISKVDRWTVLSFKIGNKARDIDFRAALSGAKNSMQLKQNITHAGHQTQLLIPNHSQTLMYRESIQPSIDGNTVDLQQEMARYTENSIQFQGSFQILNSSFKGLAKAIKGE